MDSSQTKNDTAYRIFTVLAALLFAVPGAALLLGVPHFTADMARLGYPGYFLAILGVWKLLGAIAILSPRLPRLKEWAYAGMIFDVSSAVISRTLVGRRCLQNLSTNFRRYYCGSFLETAPRGTNLDPSAE